MSKTKKPMTVVEFARKGGIARKKALSPERRKAIGRQGAMKRWGNRNPFQYLPYER